MKRFVLANLQRGQAEHVLGTIFPGRRLYAGGLAFHSAGERAHDQEPHHSHPDGEAFVFLQGEGVLELDDHSEPVGAGDVIVIEPDENHHVTSSQHAPLITLWLHANDAGHPKQYPKS